MKAFLVCFLLISALLFPLCVSARELVQNEMMITSDSGGGITAGASGGSYKGYKPKPKPKQCPKKKKGKKCTPPAGS